MKHTRLKNKLIKELLINHRKQYYCHIQFVVKIGLQLSENYNVDKDIVEIACLLHDIGRDKELEGEDHPEAGARIAKKMLENTGLSEKQIQIICGCIRNHGNFNPDLTLEEKIVLTADSASKVLYHEAFMLMCKKETYKEKLEWGIKYLEKGYKKVAFPEYKEKVAERYKVLRSIYNAIEG